MQRQLQVVVLEPIPEVGPEWLISMGAQVMVNLSPADSAIDPLSVQAVIVRRTRVDAAFLARFPALQVVGRYGAGLDGVDQEAAAERGVVVTNAPGANTKAVAEHTVALFLAAARDLAVSDRMMRVGRFAERTIRRYHVTVGGSRVGILGPGRIGTSVAQILATGFDCEVGLCYRPGTRPADPFGPFESFDSARDLLRWADHLVVTAPLTPSTRDLIRLDDLRLLGPDGLVVVASRGGIVNEQDLATALAAGTIRAAGVDVYESEPPAGDHPLRAVPQAVLTPHVGGRTREAQTAMSLAVCKNVWAALVDARPPA